jgi:hypothetical protein
LRRSLPTSEDLNVVYSVVTEAVFKDRGLAEADSRVRMIQDSPEFWKAVQEAPPQKSALRPEFSSPTDVSMGVGPWSSDHT